LRLLRKDWQAGTVKTGFARGKMGQTNGSPKKENGMNIAEKTVDQPGIPLTRDVTGVQTRRAVDGWALSTSWLPEPEFSGSIYSETSRNPSELIEWTKALEDEKLRLQALVCHLLRENEQLRNRNHGEFAGDRLAESL
jgi:hypothetical protein